MSQQKSDFNFPITVVNVHNLRGWAESY